MPDILTDDTDATLDAARKVAIAVERGIRAGIAGRQFGPQAATLALVEVACRILSDSGATDAQIAGFLHDTADGIIENPEDEEIAH